MSAHEIRRQQCPHCGVSGECVSNLTSQAGPHEDAITVCIKCGEVSMFRADLTQRALVDEEIEALSLSTKIKIGAIQNALWQFQRARKAHLN